MENLMTKDEPISKKDYYKGVINYEAILGGQITRAAMYRDTNLRQYASSIETYALMCPPEICDKALKRLSELGLVRCQYQSMNSQKQQLYDDLWRFINTCLKKDANLIFKTAHFEIGYED